MKATSRIFGVIVLLLGFIALAMGLKAQNVVRKGNTFIEQGNPSTKKGGIIKTHYLFTDKNGVTDTIYVSASGKAFIFKTSKKSGKRYRKYLPAVTKRFNTK